jgi:large subunit ribosomal protein L3
MLAAILGRKIGMTQVYDASGAVQPVTVIQAGPCSVLQVKTTESDGYNAVQLGFEDVRAKRATKPQVGHAAKANVKPKRFIREVRLADPPKDVRVGQTITVESFFSEAKAFFDARRKAVDPSAKESPAGPVFVDVTGTTKGKGFQGVMKRHHFAGQPQTHGTERKHRSPGSQSAHATNRGWGGNIKKGKRMSGHMGMVRCTSRNHKLVGIDKDNHLLLVKGSVPGAGGGFVYVTAGKTARIAGPARVSAKAAAKAAAKARADAKKPQAAAKPAK